MRVIEFAALSGKCIRGGLKDGWLTCTCDMKEGWDVKEGCDVKEGWLYM